MRRSLAFCILLSMVTLSMVTAAPVLARGEKKKIAALAEKYRQWLGEVEPLIAKEELAVFLELVKDYQRDDFIDKFWRSRDPHPETERNEFKSLYYGRRATVAERYKPNDDRARFYLLNGEPHGIFETQCALVLWPLEIWNYEYSDLVRRPFNVIFYQPSGGGPFRQWNREEGYRPLVAIDFGASDFEDLVYRKCQDRDVILPSFRQAEFEGPLHAALRRPEPVDDEWLQTFQHFSTDLPEGAEPLEVGVRFAYPGVYKSRTVVLGELAVAVAAAGVAELEGQRTYNFLLTGEVLRHGELFETFRYRFDLPAAEVASADVPLLFERFLRPGDYSFVLKVEDLNSKRLFRTAEAVAVPKREAADGVLAEAEEAAAEEAEEIGPALELTAPVGEILTGAVRFEATARGDEVRKVAFVLDDKPLLTKTRPPYSVEVNLGTVPRTHIVRAAAFDGEGREIASDELVVNGGQHLFAVELVEPRSDTPVADVLRTRAEVRVPEGATLERVEIYLDETRLATLYSPPFVQPLKVPAAALAFVRAVAYLSDGNSTEDLVLLGAPGYVDETEVRMVELYTTVLDGQGRPLDRLARDEFSIFENGVEQELLRFERLDDLPIHATLLIDTSASMQQNLPAVNRAALDFLKSTIEPKDRAAIVTFSEQPRLVAKFTHDLDELARALAGFKAERSTALYDSLVFSLFYMKGIKGQRVLLVLSDGIDRRSERTFGEVLELAGRENVTIYTIGVELKKASPGRKRLSRLAEETGGVSFFIDSVDELATIYERIEKEIRSQYLLAYQSSLESDGGDFRLVDVRVRSGGEARTLRGYYP